MTWRELAITVVLLAANGFFVAAEFALVAARRTKLQQLAEEGSTLAGIALKSIRELSFMLAGAQLGITAASLGLGAVTEPAIAGAIEHALEGTVEMPSGLVHSIAFVVALTIVVFFHMVLGEMAPKNIAIAEPEASALWLAVPIRIYVNLFRPLLVFLNALANGMLRIFRVEPVDELMGVHSADEIGVMISESARAGLLGAVEHRLLAGAIGFAERDAAAVMVPRTSLVTIPATASPAEIERVVLDTGHSRLPVHAGDVDDMLGFFHAKDLLKVMPDERSRPLSRRLVRQMLVVPESRRLHPLLVDMQRQRRQLALVVDEHGGTAGIVTIEDLIEELVGDIRDEYDVAELGIQALDDGRYIVPGSLRIDEAEKTLGLRLPHGDYETVAGFVMDRLGRIPRRRDMVTHDGWSLRVRSMHRRRIMQILIERATAGDGAPEQAQR